MKNLKILTFEKFYAINVFEFLILSFKDNKKEILFEKIFLKFLERYSKTL